MRIVKEHIIFEKFSEDSDPIKDLGIGMKHAIEMWLKSTDNSYTSDNWALIVSSIYGKTEFVEYLLKNGADPNSYGGDHLRWSSENGHIAIVKLLLDAGADVHADNDYALRYASRYGNKEVVKILLDAGADVHAEEGQALEWAIKYGHIEIVKLLQDHIDKEKLKESLNEKFTEDSDVLDDMNIGAIRNFRNVVNLFAEKDIKEYIFTFQINKSSISLYFNGLKILTLSNEKIKTLPEYIQSIIDDLQINKFLGKRTIFFNKYSGREKIPPTLINYKIKSKYQNILKESKYRRRLDGSFKIYNR